MTALQKTSDTAHELVNGKIPPNTICPYREKCPSAKTDCGHRGIEHKVAYSCGTARLFKTFTGK